MINFKDKIFQLLEDTLYPPDTSFPLIQHPATNTRKNQALVVYIQFYKVNLRLKYDIRIQIIVSCL